MYVRYGSPPTLTSWDSRPRIGGNNETCPFASLAAGTWHVSIRGWSACPGVPLTGDHDWQRSLA